MKKILFLLLAVATVTLNAQVYTHHFEGETAGTDLETLDAWFVCDKDGYKGGASPIFSDQDMLYYKDYAGSEKGLSVEIDSVNGGSEFGDATRRYSSGWNISGDDTLKFDASQTYTAADTYYAAFLVKPFGPDFGSMRDIFQLEMSPSLGNWSRCRVFMDIVDGTDVQFGIGKKNGPEDDGSDVSAEVANGVDATYLLVAAYEQVAGENNDVVKLYVNPDPTMSAADQTGVVLVSADLANDWNSGDGVLPLRVNICQRGHTAEIAGIRVGKNNWQEVLQGAAVTAVSLDMVTMAIDIGASDTLTATVTPEDAGDPSISWSSSDLAVAIVVNGIVTGISEGTATITVTTTDGTLTADCVVTVSTPVGISELSDADVSVYPNPSSGIFNVENCEGANLSIYSVTGQEVYNKQRIANHEIISDDFAKGVYILRIELDNKSIAKRLVIK